jgi:hypothetical protein
MSEAITVYAHKTAEGGWRDRCSSFRAGINPAARLGYEEAGQVIAWLFLCRRRGISAVNSVRFSFDFDDSNAAVDPYPQSASIINGDGSAVGQLVAMGLNDKQDMAGQGGNYYMARIRGVNVSAFFKLNQRGPETLRSTGWHNLPSISLAGPGALSFKFYVDDYLARTFASVALPAQSYGTV